MADIQECFEIDDTINKLLINQVRERPTLYYTDTYTETDEKHWDAIQNSTGIQKSWLKKRWKTIRNDHRKITIYNHMHSKKVPLHKMAKELDFFVVDLNGANELDFEEIKRLKKESFCITQEMLDNCDINEGVTIDSITVPKCVRNEPPTADQRSDIPSVTTESLNEKEITSLDEDMPTNNKESPNENAKQSVDSSTNDRCEDTIFGELVVAMLKKMKPEEKKRAKKEIMNILL